jgi:hypothetical protein
MTSSRLFFSPLQQDFSEWIRRGGCLFSRVTLWKIQCRCGCLFSRVVLSKIQCFSFRFFFFWFWLLWDRCYCEQEWRLWWSIWSFASFFLTIATGFERVSASWWMLLW